MRAGGWFENGTDGTDLVRGVATMGAPLVKFLVAVIIAGTLIGCGKMSAETVRDKDRQRVEAARGMPGNDIPPDPADMAR